MMTLSNPEAPPDRLRDYQVEAVARRRAIAAARDALRSTALGPDSDPHPVHDQVAAGYRAMTLLERVATDVTTPISPSSYVDAALAVLTTPGGELQ